MFYYLLSIPLLTKERRTKTISNSSFSFRLGIEGEREFKSKLSEINQNMKVLGSELKVVSSAFDGQEKSVRSLSARNDVLKKTVDEQKEKVRLLTEALQNASESFGENDRSFIYQTNILVKCYSLHIRI